MIVLTFGCDDFARPGYTPDEEFTEFAVRGIAATGLPLLPSGLLYDRGVAYSYAAWAIRSVFGDGLAPLRMLSAVCALAALGALWHAVRHVSTGVAASLAVLLTAASVPFWTVATTARFYAPFLASYLALLAMLAWIASLDSRHRMSVRQAVILLALGAVCRWTHELAFTILAVPVACAALATKGERAKWLYPAAAIGAGLVIAQAGLFALHFLAPQSGETMIRRFFLWQVLNLFERPPAAPPLGLALIITLVAIVLRPQQLVARRPSAIAVRAWLTLVALLGAMALFTGTHDALAYPLDLFAHIARTMPALTLATLGALAARASGLGGPWTPGERAAHLLWLGWVVFFGVIESGITINYLLAPVTLMLASLAIDLTALMRHRRAWRIPAAAAALFAGIAAVWTMWGSSPRAALIMARPTIVAPNPAQLRAVAAGASMVACTDELACLLLAGRVDRWLALDDFLRERFIVQKASGPVGVYAGAPVALRLADLFSSPDGRDLSRVLVIDVFKELPVGQSSTFLPRATAAEGVRFVTRIETSQLRVIELRPDAPRQSTASGGLAGRSPL